MSEERLHFGSDEYDAFYASQHIGRYHILRGKCEGKSVLDVACGEGYGSRLMARWGAKSVVGVDNSPEAVAEANRLFSAANIEFHVHDAHNIDTLLKGRRFDVIACFETIEHLIQPGRFLTAIKKLVARNALIVISCPNEKADYASPAQNPFHVAAYTLEEFQAITEHVLGKATHWLLGTPMHGMVTFEISNIVATNNSATFMDSVNPDIIDLASLIPPKKEVVPAPSNCLYFVGAWGELDTSSSVITPCSYPAFVSPWAAIQQLQQQLEDRNATVVRLNKWIEVIGAEASCYRSRTKYLTRSLQQKLKERDIAIETLNKRMGVLRAETSSYRFRVQHLTSSLKASRGTIDSLNADYRSRIQDLARSLEISRGTVVSLNAELEHLNTSWFVKLGKAYGQAHRLPIAGLLLGASRRFLKASRRVLRGLRRVLRSSRRAVSKIVR